jgi:(1->4)-alpha-D-glucan 1-alpha-D-glucosylmutase
MAISSENAWWMDVLEHGRASRYARVFDIDWTGAGLEDRVLVPILGRPYGEALEAGELRLVLEPEGLRIAYAEHRLPIDPADYARVLGSIGAVAPVVDRSHEIPARSRTDARSVARRARSAERLKADLWTAYAGDRAVRSAVDRSLRSWSGRPGEPATFDRLDALIGDQAYVVSYWRSALYEIDYRRFFDVPELVSLRQDDPEVFEATHALILRLVGRYEVDGLRIDHVDGLLDPAAYLVRLRQRIGERYLVVEKILGRDEHIPRWSVDGTTGYEFLRDVAEVLVDAEGVRRLDDAFAESTGDARPFERAVVDAKLDVMRGLFSSETSALALRLKEIARGDRHARDLPAEPLREAIALVTAELDVYRTYVDGPELSATDRQRIERALEGATRSAGTDAAVALAFLGRVLLLEGVRAMAPARARDRIAFVMRWQQLSGPVMAKGLEDTVLYRRVAFVALNDVGVHPTREPVDVDGFHARIRARARTWPRGMLATATHDTKRGEDVRARIAVLSELSSQWLETIERWTAWNRPHASTTGGVRAPDVAEEWLLYQTLVGVWPVGVDPTNGAPVAADRAAPDLVDRVVEYLRKSMREAKRTTDWLEPNEAHEAAVERFVRTILASGTPFARDLVAFSTRVAWHGALNALSQLVLKVASPGVSDVYQGTELWDLTLVDPDNRRPVDFDAREAMLSEFVGADPGRLLASWPDGRVKLLILHRLLGLRRKHRALFLEGDYVPVGVDGPRADRVIAFERRRGRERVLVVVPRRTVGVADEPGRPPVFGSTALTVPRARRASGVDVLSGAPVSFQTRTSVDEVLGILPAAVVVSAR